MSEPDPIEVTVATLRRSHLELMSAFDSTFAIFAGQLAGAGILDREKVAELLDQEAVGLGADLSNVLGGDGEPNPFLVTLATALRNSEGWRLSLQVIEGGKAGDPDSAA